MSMLQREKEEGKTKLEESRAYLALGWMAGIAGVDRPIILAQLVLDSPVQKPISSAQLTSLCKKPHEAYKER
jgi:hypothetical protein